MMRSAGRLLAVAFILSSSGCAWTRDRNGVSGLDRANPAKVDVQKIADRVNANSRAIKSIVCDRVLIDGRARGPNGHLIPYTLDAHVAFQNPSNFRLRGNMLGRPEVDLGSNSNEIWVHAKRVDPGAVLFCKREDLPRVNLAIPFHPDWLAEVLGVIEIDPTKYRFDREQGRFYSLISYQTTPTGQPAIKRLVFERAAKDRIHSIVLYDAANTTNVLARAEMLEYLDDPKTGVTMPRVVRLEWPETQMELKLSFQRGTVQFNTIDKERAELLFTRDNLSNLEAVDLAKVQRGGSNRGGLQPRRPDRGVEPSAGVDLGEPQPTVPPGFKNRRPLADAEQ